MKLPARDDRRIDEEAAAWLEILNKGGTEERRAFAAWARESPRHVRSFLLMTALDGELAGLDPGKKQALELDATRVVHLHPDAALPARTSNETRRVRAFLWAAGIAALAVIGALASWLSPARYSTIVGEQRTLDMPDGSVVYLNTDSRIALAFSKETREIRLIAGEALFKVARDKTRPFRVRTDDTVLQAIGTEFNVRRDTFGTRVAVIQGAIQVADQKTPLVAGEEASIQREARVVTRAPADVARTMAWRQRRLVFRSDRLADIAAEFNRYNRSPQIRIAEESLEGRRFSGVFDADDPEALGQVLEGNDGLRVERSEEEIVIRIRQ